MYKKGGAARAIQSEEEIENTPRAKMERAFHLMTHLRLG